MYQGPFFRSVTFFVEKMNYDFKILSAKYGLVDPDKELEPYDKIIKYKKDIEYLKKITHNLIISLLNEYDKIILLMGKKYVRVFEDFIPNPKILTFVDHQGNGGFLRLASFLNKIPKKQISEILEQNNSSLSKEDLQKYLGFDQLK